MKRGSRDIRDRGVIVRVAKYKDHHAPYRLRKHKRIDWGYTDDQLRNLRDARLEFDKAYLTGDTNRLVSAQQTFCKVLRELGFTDGVQANLPPE